MLRDLSGEKKVDQQVVLDAIRSLEAQGLDVTVYAVADEAKIPRSALFRNAELMELIEKSRLKTDAGNEPPPPPDVEARVRELEQWNRELEERVAELEAAVKALTGSGREQQSFYAEPGYAEPAAAQPSGTAHGGAPEDVAMVDEPPDALTADSEFSAFTDASTYDQPEPEVSGVEALQHALASTNFTPGSTAEDDPEEAPYGQPESEYAEETAPPPRGQADQGFVSDEFLRRFGAGSEGSRDRAQDAGSESYDGYGEAQSLSGAYQGEVDAENGEYAYGESGELSDDDEAGINQDELRDLVSKRFTRKEDEEPADKDSDAKKMSGTKFVGGARAAEPPPPKTFVIRNVPPDIRKACLVLGLRPEELTYETVNKAWKREMANPGGHPDLGGDTEIAIYMNTAKDALFKFLDAQAPKLGKKFGASHTKDQPKTQTEKADAGPAPQE